MIFNDEEELSSYLEEHYNTSTNFYFLVTDSNGWPYFMYETEDGDLFGVTVPQEGALETFQPASADTLDFPLALHHTHNTDYCCAECNYHHPTLHRKCILR